MAFTAGTVLNGLRLRHRLSGLTKLAPIGPPGSRGDVRDPDVFVFVHAPSVEVDDATRSAAAAHAEAEDLDVVDLVPGDIPAAESMDLARLVDTVTFRSAALAAGRGAGYAIMVRRSVWDRANPALPASGAGATSAAANAAAVGARRDDVVEDAAGMVALAERLKQYAARSTDFVVAPGLHAVALTPGDGVSRLEALYRGAFPLALGIPAARSALVVGGLALSPGWGVAAAAGFALQPYLATAGTAVQPPQRSPFADAIGRVTAPLALLSTALAAAKPGGASAVEDRIEVRRPGYTAALAQGTQRFFESRRDTCPWCSGSVLVQRIKTADLVQSKPGEFVIDECVSCGLLFQNPRLSLDGLDFYYRDAYDGLGEDETQFLFAHSEPSYRGRVELVRRHTSPRAWLDVGTGYGHFCVVARGLLPETRFDGLDMGTSVEESQRRGWIDNAYRGMFPDLTGELRGSYDVVSMHHYLEHTRDPRAELAAAHAVLEPGGHLLVEVPDPESRFARVHGRYWVPWFQPQHQQFLTVGHLSQALEAQGFEIVEVERGPAHQPVDIGGGFWTLTVAVAPPPRLPWRDVPTTAQRLERLAVLATMMPVAGVGVFVDRLLQPVIATRAQSWSNTYRLLARRL